MAEANPPEGPDEQQNIPRVSAPTLVGGVAAYLLFGAALWWALDQYIDPQISTEKQPIAQAVGLIMAGAAAATAIIYYALRLRREEPQDSREPRPIPFPEPMPPNAKDTGETAHIWDFYTEMGLIERHFNKIQSGYRTLASTWLLGAFAAIGFVLSTELPPLIPRELLMAGIGIASSIGVCLIWVLDLLVNQRLLDASFIQSKNLEATHRWLPQIRNTMRVLLRGKGLRLVIWFYIAGTEVMAFVGGVGLLLWLSTTPTPVVLVFLIAIDYVIVMGLVLVLMYVKTSTTLALEGTKPSPGGTASGGS